VETTTEKRRREAAAKKKNSLSIQKTRHCESAIQNTSVAHDVSKE